VCSFPAGLPYLRDGKHLFVRTIAAVVVASVFAVAGCGGDDGGETTNGTSSQTFSISESDFGLTPSTVTIDAPGTYTFEATNDGGVDHSLEIEGNGVEEETETIGPGESASVTVDLETGTYEMYCPISNHRELGMAGEVTVG
jgi:plastocyanin